MKQILQSARSGELQLVEVPAPAAGPGQVLVQNHFSVVSPGTEKLAMSFARKSLIAKARSRPDLVKQVVHKLRQEGPLPTYRTVMNRLDSPQPLGYSCAGVVAEVGAGVVDFAPGDRVACAGAGYANHAEWVAVPANLVAHVPANVPLDRAAFATLGAIAMQGLRIAQPGLGEVVAVVGLGLIGQLAVQLLRANGCRVLGLDVDPQRVKEALDLGAEWAFTPGSIPAGWRDAATAGHGVDFALVTASANDSAPIELSAELCRHKGRVVVIGAVPLELERRSFYEKELELRLSTSYGPGRYDRHYEEEGLDYPLAYVRWTENRNLQAFLALTASGALHPEQIPAETVPFEEAERAYEALAKGERRSLAVVFRYAADASRARSLELKPATATAHEEPGIAFLGVGNYAKAVLLPALQEQKKLRRVALVTATGASARRSAERFGFARCGTDAAEVLRSHEVDAVFIATRHDSHAELAVAALAAGKAVWLEKPVGLSRREIASVAAAAGAAGSPILTVGYNRRFSSHARAIREAFAGRQGPLAIHYTVAAGPVPAGTWILDPAVGGGRIVGEACHFIDLCTHLIGELPASVYAHSLSRSRERDDSTALVLGYPGGSVATIHYLSRASSELPKERFEVSGDGLTAHCDNFRETRIHGGRGPKRVRGLNQDKGQQAALDAFVAAVRSGGPAPIPLAEIISTSLASFSVAESIAEGRSVRLGADEA